MCGELKHLKQQMQNIVFISDIAGTKASDSDKDMKCMKVEPVHFTPGELFYNLLLKEKHFSRLFV